MTASQRSLLANHQRTLPLDPGLPGANLPSSGILSPGTGVPDAAGWELDSVLIESSYDAQEESNNAITKNKAAQTSKRSLTVTNLTSGRFDASRRVR
jgi:hypothetical protein